MTFCSTKWRQFFTSFPSHFNGNQILKTLRQTQNDAQPSVNYDFSQMWHEHGFISTKRQSNEFQPATVHHKLHEPSFRQC